MAAEKAGIGENLVKRHRRKVAKVARGKRVRHMPTGCISENPRASAEWLIKLAIPPARNHLRGFDIADIFTSYRKPF